MLIRSLGLSLWLIQAHPHTSLWRVDSGLWSTLETAAHPARPFLGSSRGSFPVSHISHLPYMRFLLVAVVRASMLCPEQVQLTPASIVHCQNCTLLGGDKGSRASGRQQRRQMQESKVTLLREYLSFLCADSWAFMSPGSALRSEWGCSGCSGVKAELPRVSRETFLMTLCYGWALWSWESDISFCKGGTLSMAARGQFPLPSVTLLPRKLPLQFPSVMLLTTASTKFWTWGVQGHVGSCCWYFNDTVC